MKSFRLDRFPPKAPSKLAANEAHYGSELQVVVRCRQMADRDLSAGLIPLAQCVDDRVNLSSFYPKTSRCKATPCRSR